MAVSSPDRVVAASPAAITEAGTVPTRGAEWIIDGRGCPADVLRDGTTLRALFERLIADLHLTPVAPAVWHTFPAPGGITGFVILAESHLACHTFPEFGSICVNVFCCRERADFDAGTLLGEVVGATETVVRRVERTYGPMIPPDAGASPA